MLYKAANNVCLLKWSKKDMTYIYMVSIVCVLITSVHISMVSPNSVCTQSGKESPYMLNCK